MQSFFTEIPNYNTWHTIQEIKAGWSSDDKYYIKNNIGKEFLLRISDKTSFKQEHAHYTAFKNIDKRQVLMPKLLAAGLCNQSQYTFRLFSWIKGEVLEGKMAYLTPQQQYAYGVQAGKMLRVIHKTLAPKNWIAWDTHYNRKIDRKITQYINCGITIKNGHKILTYIQKNRHLISNRTQSFHHGDFHIGNMLLTPQKKLAIIDFNRLDFGDPWEEFNRITWSAASSPFFASGQINGYFNHRVPSHFFALLALYIGVNQLGSIAWAIPYGQQEINTLLAQSEQVLTWYNNFQQIIPTWYSSTQ